MKLPLSDRLLSCASFVSDGSRVADIGCDHGYLGIHLIKNCNAASVIAADINEAPLQSAMRNAEKYGVRDRMTFHLSDGVRNIPRDFDTLVCAGMGADTMVSILEAAPWLKSNQYRLILQCQSKTPMLRAYLSENGWRITEESVLRDGRFLYTVMEVYYQPDYPRLSLGECWFPPALLENPGQETIEYFRRLHDGLAQAVSHGETGEKAQALAFMDALAATPELTWLKEDLHDNG